MSWPLELVVTTGAAAEDSVLRIPGPGRYALAAVPDDATLDLLLANARTHLGQGGVGWVPETGGLLRNLPAWENILLTVLWHAPASLPAMEMRVRGWTARLGYDEAGTQALLSRQPDLLSTEEQNLIGWLRELLSRPKLILLAGRSLPAGVIGRGLRSLIDEELAGTALVVVDRPPPPDFGLLAFEAVMDNEVNAS